jgi:hypothetical protein
MLTTIALLAGTSVAAVLVTGARCIGLRRIVKHSTKTDVAFTAGTAFVLGGTLTGIATAILAGLMMALVLSALKALYALKDRATAVVSAVSTPVYDDNDVDQYGNWKYNQAPYLRGGDFA